MEAYQPIYDAVRSAAAEYERPSAVFRPRVFIDGDRWCALYGENLQDGVAGFGDSPAKAMWDFDRAWQKDLTPNAGGKPQPWQLCETTTPRSSRP